MLLFIRLVAMEWDLGKSIVIIPFSFDLVPAGFGASRHFPAEKRL